MFLTTIKSSKHEFIEQKSKKETLNIQSLTGLLTRQWQNMAGNRSTHGTNPSLFLKVIKRR